jgi:hypothetical protein
VVQHRPQIQLITNNFKIKSKNHGVIYTYKVDFLEGSGPGGATTGSSSMGGGYETHDVEQSMSMMSLGKMGSGGSSSGLETF